MQLISLSIPYLYLLHVLIISIRVGATLLFAPIWGYPGLPQYLRILLVFSIAAGISAVIPFNAQALSNPGLGLQLYSVSDRCVGDDEPVVRHPDGSFPANLHHRMENRAAGLYCDIPY